MVEGYTLIVIACLFLSWMAFRDSKNLIFRISAPIGWLLLVVYGLSSKGDVSIPYHLPILSVLGLIILLLSLASYYLRGPRVVRSNPDEEE